MPTISKRPTEVSRRIVERRRYAPERRGGRYTAHREIVKILTRGSAGQHCEGRTKSWPHAAEFPIHPRRMDKRAKHQGAGVRVTKRAEHLREPASANFLEDCGDSLRFQSRALQIFAYRAIMSGDSRNSR